MDFKAIIEKFTSGNLLPAAIVLLAGCIVIKLILAGEKKALEKSKRIDPMAYRFIRNATNIILWVVLIIEVLKLLGVQSTSLVTMVAAGGAAIALALQGSLSNLAGGILIMFAKPFVYGDYIECNGIGGTVEAIDLLCTSVITPDGKIVTLPNSSITNTTVTNFTKLGKRRVDVDFGISYHSDIDTAREAVIEMARQDGRFLMTEPFECNVMNYSASSVDLEFRGWCRPGDYWGVLFDTRKGVKNALAKAGVEIPFPQMDVHIDNK